VTSLEKYLAAGRAAGCPPDQMANFVKAGVVLQPRQLAASAAARLCDQAGGPTALLMGGARAGGKSFWMLAQAGADDCIRVPGLKVLVLRKIGKAGSESLSDLRQQVFAGLKHSFSAYRGIVTFPNGSRIIAGHFNKESDVDAYLGLEFDLICLEECSTLTWRKFQDISTCCRTSKPNWRPRIYATTNPGGVGHAWCKKKFITPFKERAELDTRFIPSVVRDNKFCNQEYRKVLEGLTGWQRRAWLEGDWDIAAGQFLTTYRREVHVVDEFDPTRAREWFCALDYGFTHYTVALLGCTDGDGNVFVVDEHAERLWLPQRHAAAIHAMLARQRINAECRVRNAEPPNTRPLEISDLKRFVAGADVFSKQSDGTTVAAQYARHGIKLTCANTDRINGWAEILQRFGDVDAGIRPTLFIHKRCGRLLDTLPALQHDPHRPEDVLKVDADEDGVGGDDSADCLRYLVATKGRMVSARKLRGV
jgi:phage terminase large subunit